MHTLHFSIEIKAPVAKVCQLMLDDAGYRQWTAPFHPTSHFIGNWQTGSKMWFVAEEHGRQQGMVSRIVAHIPQQHLYIEHIGILKEGTEILQGADVEPWAGAREDYHFTVLPDGCRLDVQLDSQQQWADFSAHLAKALAALKALAES